MIRSAVRTTLQSLLRSDLVAELNQTVIDVQRMDSMMAEQNCFSSSCGMLNFLSWRRRYRLYWAFFNGLNVIVQLQILRNCGAKNLNDSTAVTVLFVMVRAGSFLLKSTIISTVLSVLSSWLSRLHQTASSFTSCL